MIAFSQSDTTALGFDVINHGIEEQIVPPAVIEFAFHAPVFDVFLLLTTSEFWRGEPSQAVKNLGNEKKNVKGIVEVKKMLMNACVVLVVLNDDLTGQHHGCSVGWDTAQWRLNVLRCSVKNQRIHDQVHLCFVFECQNHAGDQTCKRTRNK